LTKNQPILDNIIRRDIIDIWRNPWRIPAEPQGSEEPRLINTGIYISVDVKVIGLISHRKFLIWKEKGRGKIEGGRWAGGQAGQQTGRFKVRLG
jgi:hypothetical protein